MRILIALLMIVAATCKPRDAKHMSVPGANRTPSMLSSRTPGEGTPTRTETPEPFASRTGTSTSSGGEGTDDYILVNVSDSMNQPGLCVIMDCSRVTASEARQALPPGPPQSMQQMGCNQPFVFRGQTCREYRNGQERPFDELARGAVRSSELQSSGYPGSSGEPPSQGQYGPPPY